MTKPSTDNAPAATDAAKPDLFTTDHLHADLKGRSVRGGAVTLASQAVRFVLQLGGLVVLARLLTPADFGLIAMVTALTGFVALFKDAGLSMATVQRDHVNHAQVSTLFWINVALSLVLMAIVAALAPAVAWFYDQRALTAVTLAIAATFILSGLTVQHTALLKRQMRFTALAIQNVAATAAGVATAIPLAWLGAGYWALVAMPAASTFVSMAFAWGLTRWLPSRPRRNTGIRSMLAFGGNLTGFNFVNYFARNADNVLIGWYWGAASLGFYTKAYSLLMLPLVQIRTPITNVVVPALSRLQNRPEQYRDYYSTALRGFALLALPIFGVGIVIADWLVLVVLGPQWRLAVDVFRWLALAGVVQITLAGYGWLMMTQGRTREMMGFGIITASISVASFIAGLPWGIEGVAAVYSLTAITLRAPLLVAVAARRGPVHAWQVVRPAISALPIALLVTIPPVIVRLWMPLDTEFGNLCIAVTLSVMVYLIAVRHTTRVIVRTIRRTSPPSMLDEDS